MDDIQHKKTNREKKLSPKLGYGYCCGCDKDIVALGSKCRVCGERMGHQRFKK